MWTQREGNNHSSPSMGHRRRCRKGYFQFLQAHYEDSGRPSRARKSCCRRLREILFWKRLRSPPDTIEDGEGMCRRRLFHTTVRCPVGFTLIPSWPSDHPSLALENSCLLLVWDHQAADGLQRNETPVSPLTSRLHRWCTALVIGAFERAMRLGWIAKDIPREAIEGFLSHYGRTFYKLVSPQQAATATHGGIRLERKGERIPQSITSSDGSIEVVPFRRGEEVMGLTWLD